MTPNGKFQPETNVPAIISLQFAQGKAVNSQYKDAQGNPKREFCFTLTTGQKWYAPEAVANEIQRHGVVANQPLQVVRRENGTIDVKPLAQASIAQPQYAPAPVVQNIYRAPEPPPPPQLLRLCPRPLLSLPAISSSSGMAGYSGVGHSSDSSTTIPERKYLPSKAPTGRRGNTRRKSSA